MGIYEEESGCVVVGSTNIRENGLYFILGTRKQEWVWHGQMLN